MQLVRYTLQRFKSSGVFITPFPSLPLGTKSRGKNCKGSPFVPFVTCFEIYKKRKKERNTRAYVYHDFIVNNRNG